MQYFYFEMTDTFCGELNYCWVHRFEVKARSLHGALIKLSKDTGYNFRYNGMYYKVKNATIGAYEMSAEEVEHHRVNHTHLKLID